MRSTAKAESRDPRFDAITSTADILKVTTSLGGAALLFGINLTTAFATTYPRDLQIALVASWVLLAASVSLGLWRLFYTPLLLASDVKVDDVRMPFALSLVALALGTLVLAAVLVTSTLGGPIAESPRVGSARDAVRTAIGALPRGERVVRVVTNELVGGEDRNRFVYDSWHVQIETCLAATCTRSPPTALRIRDVYVDPNSGSTYVAETNANAP